MVSPASVRIAEACPQFDPANFCTLSGRLRWYSLRATKGQDNDEIQFRSSSLNCSFRCGAVWAIESCAFVNQPLVPAMVAPGAATFMLTVNGTGFVSGSVVNWNGSARATTFVNSSKLTATILATDVSVAQTGTVTVTSPNPGGGVSNPVFLGVTNPFRQITFAPLSFGSVLQPL